MVECVLNTKTLESSAGVDAGVFVAVVAAASAAVGASDALTTAACAAAGTVANTGSGAGTSTGTGTGTRNGAGTDTGDNAGAGNVFSASRINCLLVFYVQNMIEIDWIITDDISSGIAHCSVGGGSGTRA